MEFPSPILIKVTYHCYCHKTTRLIKEKFNKVEIQTTFQSRFGPQEWLTLILIRL